MPTRRQIMAKIHLSIGILMVFLVSGCVTAAPEQSPQIAANANMPLPATLYGDFLAGRHAQSKRDFKKAATYFGRALSRFPDDKNLLHRNLFLTMIVGDFAQASTLAERMRIGDIKSDSAVLVQGITQVKSGDFAEANKTFGQLTDRGINIFLRPMAQSWSQMGAGDTDGALKTLSVMQKRDELANVYNFHAGLINELSGRTDKVEALYLKPADLPGGLPPRSIDVLASFYLQQNQSDKAAALFDTYIQENPDVLLIQDMRSYRMSGKPVKRPIDTATEGLAEVLFDTATSLRQSGAADLALFYVQASLVLEPNFPLAQMLLGDIWHKLGRYDEAVAAYGSISEGSAVSYSAKLRQTASLFGAEKTKEAVAVLNEMSKSRQDRTDALLKLGRFLSSDERFKESAATYSKALDRVQTIEPYHWILFFNRGIAYERAKIWDKAEVDFLKALELYPDQPDVLNYLGYSWLEKDMHLVRARKMIEKAIELQPRNGAITDSLGWVYFLAGEYENAVKTLKRAVELEASDATINEHYGDALWRVGREIEASFQWTRALSLDPPEKFIPGIKDKLKNGLPELGKK